MIAAIRDYALIGDTRTAALVSSAGAIDWMCWPRFDSEPLFGRLIDQDKGGSFELTVNDIVDTRRRYRDASALLLTEWQTTTGEARLTEAMVMGTRAPVLIRLLECTGGTVRAKLVYRPRPGIPGRPPRGISLSLQTAPRLELSHDGTWSGALQAGERLTAAMTERRSMIGEREAAAMLERTHQWWQQWSNDIRCGNAYRDVLVRSLITLKLLTYSPSGAPVAAPTTSLPEEIGGSRNWDYRFSWPRDASVGVAAFLAVGLHREACAFVEWLTTCAASGQHGIRVLYTLDGRAGSTEREVTDVSGYMGSLPVRIGNLAQEQHQLDVYGWVIDAIWNLVDAGHRLGRGSRKVLADYADYVCREWRRPDAGIWEVREEPRDYVHSKVWAWIALDRAARTGRALGMDRRRLAMWESTRDVIAAEVRERGFNAELGSYVRAYCSPELDTAVLLLPLTGFDDPSGSRVSATVEAIWRELGAGDPLLYRYPPGADGLPGREGAFLPCSFWLLEALLRLGRHEEGLRLFDQVLGVANDLLLLPEEIDPATGDYLGNYPLALSQAGLIHAVIEVQKVMEGNRPTQSKQRISPALSR
ncbi:MAG: glycoside hydrolase family 15 protein [Chloroflexi bacterium]|nr:MAG: glycoside hydrolase family 15 protein [Chloroflexota bacterium]